MIIKFYKVSDKYGCFSNFSQHPFTIDGVFYKTVEHYFQSNKFIEKKYKQKVLNAKTAMEAAKLGRKRDFPLRKDWEKIKDNVMRKAVKEKFLAHENIREILLSTGDNKIVEETTDDCYWGCGTNGTGKNMLGKILMEVRDKIR